MLITGRLLLRPWREEDRDPFAQLNADAQVMRYFPRPGIRDRLQSDALVDRMMTNVADLGYCLWAVERRSDAAFLGFTGLNPMPDGVPGAGGTEVGWRLARHAWGHGYATEAARANLADAFGRLELPEVWSMTAVLNTPSQAVMRRIGMSEHARLEHPNVDVDDPVRPCVVYRLARPTLQ